MTNTLNKLSDNVYKMDSIIDIVRFRDDIKIFKNTAWNLIENFFKEDGNSYYTKNSSEKSKVKYNNFVPMIDERGNDGEHRNVGVYSTVLCLEVIIKYHMEHKCKTDYFSKDYCTNMFKFVVRGLSHRLFENDCSKKSCKLEPAVQPWIISKINCLNRIYPFYKKYILDNQEILKDIFIQEEIGQLNKILLYTILSFKKSINRNAENIHPYIFYKFLQLLDKWEDHIADLIKVVFDSKNRDNKSRLIKVSTGLGKFEISFSPDDEPNEDYWDINYNDTFKLLSEVYNGCKGRFKDYFFNDVYLHAKYELYRQMALNLSGDMTLFDVKRLIYSLLVVSIDDRFSNTLIRDRALSLIFHYQTVNPNAMWPTGQLLHVSKDSLQSITAVECAFDLLGNNKESKNEFLKAVSKFLPEIKSIFHNVMRSAQIDIINKNITGWFSFTQRDKRPTSWTSALTLLFLQRFCKLLSVEIRKRAENFFVANYRDTNIDWNHLYDCNAVKSKLRLMFSYNEKSSKEAMNLSLKTAMFFGPPGTGKTTIARALATKLKCKYLELTPGDFFAGGESAILPKINDIFFHLQQLEDTVVFIDEIDDLVISREKTVFDPRTLFVNTLLPRFQEIHDHGKIILIASTNHIAKVDAAISRLGRFDMIIPVGPLSIHGRVDIFIREFIEKFYSKKVNPSDINDKEKLLFVLSDFVDSTKFFTYSQIKIFIDEMKKQISDTSAYHDNPSQKIKSLIGQIKSNLAFDSKRNKFDLDSEERAVRIIVENENQFLIKIRPFSKHDIDDVNVNIFPTHGDGLKIEAIEVILLYLYLYEMSNNNSYIEFFIPRAHFENNLPSLSEGILNKLLKKSDKYKSHYYNIVTPFYDTLESVLQGKNPQVHQTSLQARFIELKNIIYKRSVC